jgi:UDP-N-acetylmuramoylalanine--D-glutamate ligase
MSTVVDSFWAALRREQFLVVGVGGITGASAARLLRRMGVPVAVSDAVANDAATALVSELGLRTREVFFGPQLPSQLDGISQVLISPGVPRSLPLLQAAKERGIPIWCDYDLLYPLYADRRIAAITGTDGKTTTTSLVGHLLRPSHSVVVLGNIGTPLCAAYDDLLQSDVVVLELSSFMLEELKQFRANVATVLNIAEDHVDRYPTPIEYAEAKRNIVRHAHPGDVFVKNLDDPCVSSWALPGPRRSNGLAHVSCRLLPGSG